jgi:rhodanese-related sulfurtransferase
MTTEQASFQRVHVDEAVRLIDSGYQVVDVRDDREWSQGHIPGARHVTLPALLANPGIHNFKDKTIFVCAVGERSAVAAEMGIALGVRKVVNLEGGTNAWVAAGLAIEVPAAVR